MEKIHTACNGYCLYQLPMVACFYVKHIVYSQKHQGKTVVVHFFLISKQVSQHAQQNANLVPGFNFCVSKYLGMNHVVAFQ